MRVGRAGDDPNTLETIFRSPDEGRPIGSERFIWSVDGQYLLLVGRHFYVEGSVRLRTGEELYLLYHLPTRRLRCNARPAQSDRFGFSDLAGISFVEPLTPAETPGAVAK